MNRIFESPTFLSSFLVFAHDGGPLAARSAARSAARFLVVVVAVAAVEMVVAVAVALALAVASAEEVAVSSTVHLFCSLLCSGGRSASTHRKDANQPWPWTGEL